jgi:hypothetical protein
MCRDRITGFPGGFHDLLVRGGNGRVVVVSHRTARVFRMVADGRARFCRRVPRITSRTDMCHTRRHRVGGVSTVGYPSGGHPIEQPRDLTATGQFYEEAKRVSVRRQARYAPSGRRVKQISITYVGHRFHMRKWVPLCWRNASCARVETSNAFATKRRYR